MALDGGVVRIGEGLGVLLVLVRRLGVRRLGVTWMVRSDDSRAQVGQLIVKVIAPAS